jgi:hypothetical protein
MNLGKLYKVKKYFWLMFPTKQASASAAQRTAAARAAVAADRAAVGRPVAHVVAVPEIASYWSKQLNCEVIYFSPDSYIVFLEEDGVFKKVLTSDGKIGWTWFNEDYIDCFEEVEREEP